MKAIQTLNNFVNNVSVFKNEFKIDKYKCTLYFQKNLSDINEFNKYFISSINSNNIKNLQETFPSTFEIISDTSDDSLKNTIFTGNIILVINDENIFYKISLSKVPERSPSESILDPTNVFGSRDGLVENIRTNIALIERKIKVNNLKIEQLFVGKRTKTEINVLSIDDITNKKNVKKVVESISKINISSVTSLNTITNIFNKKSIFPLVSESGSSEYIADSLLRGKVIILVDQIPIAIILPVTVDYFTSNPEASSSPPYYSIYTNIITYLLVFLSIFFLGMYIAIINYHSNNLSLVIISEIKITARGTTIPLALEIILTLILFDILKMANTKTPSSSIQNVVVIVGGLLIGQNTVNSGFIGAFNLVITAICYLSTFGVTNNQHLITSFSILRLIVLIFSIAIGLYGFLIATLLIIFYLDKLRSIDTPYLAPFSPLIKNDVLLSFLPKETLKKKKRPKILNTTDKDYGE